MYWKVAYLNACLTVWYFKQLAISSSTFLYLRNGFVPFKKDIQKETMGPHINLSFHFVCKSDFHDKNYTFNSLSKLYNTSNSI